MKEKLTSKVEFDNWSYECVSAAIDFLYSIPLPDDISLLVEIYQLADSYNFFDLENEVSARLCQLSVKSPATLVPLLNFFLEVEKPLFVQFFSAAAANFFGYLTHINALEDLPDPIRKSLRVTYSKLRRGVIVKRRGSEKGPNLCPSGVIKIFVWGDTDVGKTTLCGYFSNSVFQASPSKKPVSIRVTDAFTCDLLEGRPHQQNTGLLLDQFVLEMSQPNSTVIPTHKDHYQSFVHRNLLLFDVTRPSTFEYIQIVRENLVRVFGAVAITLVATKIDILQREVGVDQARDLALKWDCPYIETSSRDNVNVTDAFRLLAREVADDSEI